MRMRIVIALGVVCGLAALSLALAACSSAVRPVPTRPAPTRAAATPAAAAQAGLQLAAADAASGAKWFASAQCVACHGAQAGGNIGPALAHTALSFDQFLTKVRTALPPKPAYSAAELPDQAAFDIYTWLQTMPTTQQAAARPPFTVVKVAPGQEQLPEGKILGMSLWTGFRCSDCHGAFAQGSNDGPALAGISYPYELERAKMRKTADQIPEHAQTFMRDSVLKRLYQWLQEGADPEGGC